MGLALLIVGGILAVIGGIGILIKAFEEGILWGVACLLLPLVSLIFVVLHWQDTKKPFLLNVAGSIIMIAGGAMSGPSN